MTKQMTWYLWMCPSVCWVVQKITRYVHQVDFSYTGLDQEIAALRIFWKSKIQKVINAFQEVSVKDIALFPSARINLN